MNKNLNTMLTESKCDLTAKQIKVRFKQLEELINKNAYLWGSKPSPRIRDLVDEFELMRTLYCVEIYNELYPYDTKHGLAGATAYDFLA